MLWQLRQLGESVLEAHMQSNPGGTESLLMIDGQCADVTVGRAGHSAGKPRAGWDPETNIAHTNVRPKCRSQSG